MVSVTERPAVSNVGRNREVVARMRVDHPDWTQRRLVEELEKETGDRLTVQRIGQILKREGLDTRALRDKKEYLCKKCNLPTKGTKFHPECREDAKHETVQCRICSKPKVMLKSVADRARDKGQFNFYCSREHFYVGKSRGFS